jgi:hypothetical protein
MFKESSYNTFDKELIDDIKKFSPLIGIRKLSVKPLISIIKQYNLNYIDFMSIDVDGLDLDVLKSNDWNIFRPKVLLVEDFNFENDFRSNSIYEYLVTVGYVYLCKTVTNAFYIEKDFYNERFIIKSK